MKYLRLTMLWLIIISLFYIISLFSFTYVYVFGLIPTYILYKFILKNIKPMSYGMILSWPVLLIASLSVTHQGILEGDNWEITFKYLTQFLKV